MKTLFISICIALVAGTAAAQQTNFPAAVPVKRGTQTKPNPKATPVPGFSKLEPGIVSGRTYSNKALGFEVTFPDSWLIPDKDFEEYMKKQGFDISLKAPDWMPPVTRAMVQKAAKNVTILLTAYEKMPGTPNNAVARISVEDLTVNPQIGDAIDYLDAIRSAYKAMKLPPEFKYSETQAERLGDMQFGYIDVSSGTDKKRMYVTVKGSYAILLTISYTEPAALETFRNVLASGNFRLK